MHAAQERFEAFSRAVVDEPPRVGMVLGSGLGEVGERLAAAMRLAFADVPGLAPAAAPGHAGQVLLGSWVGRRVVVFSGRLHAYEGHDPDTLRGSMRWMARWGVRRLVLTNAAGGIRSDLTPGALMVVRAHLDWSLPLPRLVDRRAGPRTRAADLMPRYAHYSPFLSRKLLEEAGRLGLTASGGTLAAMLGPNYETPAEVRALRWAGADAVGMSTACEASEAARLRLETAAVSCITNRAAGLGPTRLSHQEVLDVCNRLAEKVGDLLEALLLRL